ncbi:MAG: hypothetical protein PHT12_04110 [Patescibacteria group bacterium]|nr:hypothetical protein [Patescibacteria group bacterium]
MPNTFFCLLLLASAVACAIAVFSVGRGDTLTALREVVAALRRLYEICRSRRGSNRRGQDAFHAYEILVAGMTCAHTEMLRAKRDNAPDDGDSEYRRECKRDRCRKAAEEYRLWLPVAGAYLAKLGDEDIVIIAEHKSEAYGGRVSPDEMAAFLRDERQICSLRASLSGGHLLREAKRFTGRVAGA